MNRASAMVTQDGADACAVYLAEDVLCVGRIEMGMRESLRRVAYRDVTQLAAWEGRRQHVRVLAWILLACFVVAALAVLAADNAIAAVVVLACGTLAFSVLMWLGRLGGVTRFRLASARTTVSGVLGGSAAKRARILGEIERRVRERQQDSGPA